MSEVKETVKEVEAKPKQAQITAVSAVNKGRLLGADEMLTQGDEPDIQQSQRQHESVKALGMA